MPKDPARNQPNYKIGGGQLNEFEFAQHQGEMTAAEHERFQGQQAAGADDAAPQTEAERIRQLMADVHEKVARRKQKQAGGAAAQPNARPPRNAPKKAGAKAKATGTKKAAKKAVKKTAKKGAKKSGGEKRAASAGKKSGASKQSGAGKQSASKRGARKSVR